MESGASVFLKATLGSIPSEPLQDDAYAIQKEQKASGISG